MRIPDCIAVCAIGLAAAASSGVAQSVTARDESMAHLNAWSAEHRHITDALDELHFGIREHHATAGVVYENWKGTDMTLSSLLPTARRALQFYVARGKHAAKADTLFAQFIDYAPQCATLVWVRKPVSDPPDRFVLTKPGTVCTPPKS